MEIEAPPKKHKVNVVIPSHLPVPVGSFKISPLIQQWYAQCQQNIENGSIGLVPECYMNGGLPTEIEEWVETNVGQVVLNFVQFIKKQF